MEESLSIEETNKIRLSLGLKPLKADTSSTPSAAAAPTDNSLEAQDRRAVDNWKQHQSALDKESARSARIEGVKKARDAARRFARLEGKGLGEADDDGGEEDTKTWVRKMKKRQKKLAEKMAREREEELQRAAGEVKEYTAEELAGVRVGHDLGELAEGEEGTILTLKDTTIEENEEEGDELISTDLAERERLQERLDLKKKKPVYNAYEEEESGEKRILAQYDEEIDGKKKKRFVLDGTGNAATDVDAHRKEVAEKLKAVAITLDLPKPEVTSDYVDPSSLKVRKPKKKKTRKRSDDADDSLAPAPTPTPSNAMDVDSTPTSAPLPKRTFEETSFIDDDDLQSSLSLQRRAALKKRKFLKPDDMARQLREESAADDVAMKDEEDDDEPGLVIDETSEFVATLRAPTIPERRKARPTPAAAAPAPGTPTAENSPPSDAGSPPDKMNIDSPNDTTDAPARSPSPPPPEISSTGLEEETTMTHGIGATLAMLNQRGLLKRDDQAAAKISLQRDREKFRTAKRLREIEAEEKAKSQRLRDRQSGKFDRMSAREREEHARWENKQRDLQEAKEMAARFREYKPDVNLSYKDEFGREMSQKEAFKHLSHQFHGKGSGKAKTEKRLKKIEDEKKREAGSSLNASATENAVQSAAKRSKQAGVRLM